MATSVSTRHWLLAHDPWRSWRDGTAILATVRAYARNKVLRGIINHCADSNACAPGAASVALVMFSICSLEGILRGNPYQFRRRLWVGT
jgi:hypothetical protein